MARELDARLIGVSTIESYRKLVRFVCDGLALKPVLYRDYCRTPEADNIVLLRHDVDHSLENAMLIARIEADMGLKSTFFMLHPGDYDQDENYYGRIENGRVVHQPDFFARCREIAAMGHEIALHNDFFQLSYLTGRPIYDLVRAEVDAFRDAGVPVVGSASHGSTFVREIDATNYEIFSDCVIKARGAGRMVRSGSWETQTHAFAMKDVGLEYEAYFVPRNIDISDTGSSVSLASRALRIENFSVTAPEHYQTIREAVEEIQGVKLVMLLHPCWWSEILPPWWEFDGYLPSGLKRWLLRLA